MQALYNILVDIVEVVTSWVVGLITLVFGWFSEFLLAIAALAVQLAMDLLPEDIQNHFSQDLFSGFADVFFLVEWFVPVYAGFGLVSSVISMLATIRLARWIIGFIPMIEG